MKSKTIVVLGGYGGTGRVVSRLLVKETDADIVIAGRRLNKAEELASQLTKEFPERNISAKYADATDHQSMIKAFKGSSMVLVATRTPEFAKDVAQAALDTDIDYLDYHFEQKTVPLLSTLTSRIEGAGRLFVTQAGFHPGLPAAFVRKAAPFFEKYDKAVIGMVMKDKIEPPKPESVYELIDVLGDYKVDVFKDGQWKTSSYKDLVRIDFGSPFGTCLCYPLQLEEIRPLPEMFGLQQVGVYVAGFNWFVDWLVTPLIFLTQKIKKGLGKHFLARLMVWGMNTFIGSTQGVAFVLDAEGEREGKTVKVRIAAEHQDAYHFTAAPIVACIKQYLDGSFTQPGLWMMGHVVDPDRLLNDMERMGIKIETQITGGKS